MIVAVIIYGVGKPLSSGGAKVAISVVLAFVLAGVATTMYIRNTPPFFSKPSNCIHHSAIGMGTGSNIPECTEMIDQKLTLESPPIKYLYPILPGVFSQSGGNLLQMSIAQASGQSKSDAGANGGYRVDTYTNLASRIAQYSDLAHIIGVPNIPNPLVVPAPDSTKTSLPYYSIPIEYVGGAGSTGNGSMCTPGTVRVGTPSDVLNNFTQCKQNNKAPPYYGLSFQPSTWDKSNLYTNLPAAGVANLNIDEWNAYIGDGTNEGLCLFARFVLCDIIGNIDLHHWVSENEPVKFIKDDNTMYMDTAKNLINKGHANDIYFYHPNSSTSSWAAGNSGSGYIHGKIGVLNNKQYNFEKFMKNIGVWLITILLSGVGMLLFWPRKGKK